MRPKI